MIRTGILTISTVSLHVFKLKQKCQHEIIEVYSELHQQRELEIKSLSLVWKLKERLYKLISKRRYRKKRHSQTRCREETKRLAHDRHQKDNKPNPQ